MLTIYLPILLVISIGIVGIVSTAVIIYEIERTKNEE